jgi:4-oxalmesaconate hydratase
MIIDCHGHYTTAPAALQLFRDAQLADYQRGVASASAPLAITDDQIREVLTKLGVLLKHI